MGQTQTRQPKTQMANMQMAQTLMGQTQTQMGQTQTGQTKTQTGQPKTQLAIADLSGEGLSSWWAVLRTLIRASLSPAEPLLTTLD